MSSEAREGMGTPAPGRVHSLLDSPRICACCGHAHRELWDCLEHLSGTGPQSQTTQEHARSNYSTLLVFKKRAPMSVSRFGVPRDDR